MNTYQTLEIERQSGVAWVWLNRSEVRNAFNDEMIAELTAAFTELGQDGDVRVMVLAGRQEIVPRPKQGCLLQALYEVQKAVSKVTARRHLESMA